MNDPAFPPLRWQDVAARRAGARIGDPIIYRPVVDSTSTLAAALVPDQAPPGSVIIADHQTAGRGRLQRPWLAAPGSSLTCTVILAPADPTWAVPMATGLALVDALAGCGIAADLKWPNDVLLSGKKCAGVLIETKRVQSSYWLLIGIGLNVRQVDPSLPTATFLDAHTETPVVREEVLVELLDRLEHWYQRAADDSAAVRTAWRARLVTLGSWVTVHASGGSLEGLAQDIAPDGSLLLRLPDGTSRTVGAGDVTLTGQWPKWGDPSGSSAS